MRRHAPFDEHHAPALEIEENEELHWDFLPDAGDLRVRLYFPVHGPVVEFHFDL
jgi:hypothetical protein